MFNRHVTFKKIDKLCAKVVAPFYVLKSSVREFHILIHPWYGQPFILATIVDAWWHFIVI